MEVADTEDGPTRTVVNEITLAVGRELPAELSDILLSLEERGYVTGQQLYEAAAPWAGLGFELSYYFAESGRGGHSVVGLRAPQTSDRIPGFSPPVWVFQDIELTTIASERDHPEWWHRRRFVPAGAIPVAWRAENIDPNTRLKDWYDLTKPALQSDPELILNIVEFVGRLVPGADGLDRMLNGETTKDRILGGVYYVGDILSFGVGSKLKVGLKSCQGAAGLIKTCKAADIAASTAFVSEVATKTVSDEGVNLLEGAAGFWSTWNLSSAATPAVQRALRTNLIKLNFDPFKQSFFPRPQQTDAVSTLLSNATGISRDTIKRVGITRQQLEDLLGLTGLGRFLKRSVQIEPKTRYRSWFQWINSGVNEEASVALACEAAKALDKGTLLVGDIHYNTDMIKSLAIALTKMPKVVVAGRSKAKLSRIVVGGDILDASKRCEYMPNGIPACNLSPEEASLLIKGVLDQIAEAAGWTDPQDRKRIVVMLGNHDSATIKVSDGSRWNPLTDKYDEFRIIDPENGKAIARFLEGAGYTVATRSPEQIAQIGPVALSHLLSQTGDQINEEGIYRYVRKDNGATQDPARPKTGFKAPRGVHLQVNFDLHQALAHLGAHWASVKPGVINLTDTVEDNFTILSVPPLGGALSDSPDNFRGFAVISEDGIPFGFELDTLGNHTPKRLRTTLRCSDKLLPPCLDQMDEMPIFTPDW